MSMIHNRFWANTKVYVIPWQSELREYRATVWTIHSFRPPFWLQQNAQHIGNFQILLFVIIYSFYNTKIYTVSWIIAHRKSKKSGYCVYGYMTVPWNSFESVHQKSVRRLGILGTTHSISVDMRHCHCASGPYADWLVSHLA